MVTCRPSVVYRLCCARGGRSWRVARELDLDDVLEYFTLDEGELALLRNKFGATRLGFVAMLKFLLWKGRFPHGGFELPGAALEHLGRQVKVAASDVSFYDFAGRATRRASRRPRRCRLRIRCAGESPGGARGWLGRRSRRRKRLRPPPSPDGPGAPARRPEVRSRRGETGPSTA